MAKSLPRAHYANFTVLLQELFTLLKQGYISSSTNGEVLSRTSAQERILKIAEANYELFKALKNTSEETSAWFNTLEKDCTEPTFVKNKETTRFSLQFSINGLADIYSAVKKERQKSTQMRIVHAIALSLGYMGWEGFHRDKSKIPNYRPLIEESNEIISQNVEMPISQEIHEIHSFTGRLDKIISNDPTVFSSLFAKTTNEIREVIINSLANQHKSEHIKESKGNPNQTLAQQFNAILECKNLSERPLLENEIELFFNTDPTIQYDWHHRAVLASALCLSVLQYWDFKKVEYLMKLAQNDNEPYVSKRAIIGLVLSLLVSFKNPIDFKTTVQQMSPLRKHINYVAGIFETLYFFLKEWGKNIKKKPSDDIFEMIKYTENYQIFEPPHSNVSYYPLNNLAFDSQEQEGSFFELLNGSISLDYYEKMEVLIKLNNLKNEQYSELISILSKEKQNYKEAEKDYIYTSFEYHYKSVLNEFQTLLGKFESKEVVLKNLLRNTNSIYISTSVSEFFPYHRYFKLMPAKKELLYASFKGKDSRICYDIGNLLFELDRKEEALMAYENVTKAEPKYAPAWFNMGILLENFDRKKEAIIAYENATNTDPKYATAWFNMGILLENFDRKKEAIIAYENTIKSDKKNYYAWIRIGFVLLEFNRNEEALIAYENATRIVPKNEYVWICMGIVLNRLNRKEHALQAYRNATKANPENAYSWLKMGSVLEELNSNKQAISAYRKATKLDPKHAKTWNNLGLLLKKMGKKEEALVAYRNAVMIDPNNLYPWNHMGVLIEEFRMKEQAVSDDEKSIKVDPKYSEAWNNLGILLEELDRKREALIAYENSTKIDPKNVSAWIRIGYLSVNFDKKEKALIAFEYAANVEPRNEYVWIAMGSILVETKRKEEALIVYKNATKANPKNAMTWYYMGLLLYKMDKKEDALMSFTKATKADPKNAKAWNNRGFVLNDLNRKDLALKAYQKAIKANPKYARAAENMGRLLCEMEKSEKAILVYLKALDSNSDNLQIRHNLGRLLFTLKQTTDAKKQFEIVLESGENKHAYLNLGHCILILENRKEAIKNYKTSLDLWNCSQEFFVDFDDDFQHIEPQGVSKEEYQKIKTELQQYCNDKKDSRT
ncbi:MAG: hypothetical protein A2W85_13405 [Bacteroidetes bacterium GWF2_41_31]|nr:MAG: hypothetical protein A2W85_13405 [Bacteroidetes bacterium GWF2_41_31]